MSTQFAVRDDCVKAQGRKHYKINIPSMNVTLVTKYRIHIIKASYQIRGGVLAFCENVLTTVYVMSITNSKTSEKLLRIEIRR